jgi:hypothetical protein
LAEAGTAGEQRGRAQPCASQSGRWNPDSAHYVLSSRAFSTMIAHAQHLDGMNSVSER